MNIHSYKKGKDLPFEVLGKLLEIICFCIFTVWQFQFIFFLVISEIIKLVRLINNSPIGLFKFPLGRDIIESTVQNGSISEVHSIQYQNLSLDFGRL